MEDSRIKRYQGAVRWPPLVLWPGILLLLWGMALFLPACSGNANRDPEDWIQVRGLITLVEARSITELELLRIRDEQGQEYTFVTEGFIGFTPAHLREHQLFGQTVLVTYLAQGDELLALRVTD